MTATELEPKDKTIIEASAKLAAYALYLGESDDEGCQWLATVLKRLADELWELV